jgi:hypothetical protein
VVTRIFAGEELASVAVLASDLFGNVPWRSDQDLLSISTAELDGAGAILNCQLVASY